MSSSAISWSSQILISISSDEDLYRSMADGLHCSMQFPVSRGFRYPTVDPQHTVVPLVRDHKCCSSMLRALKNIIVNRHSVLQAIGQCPDVLARTPTCHTNSIDIRCYSVYYVERHRLKPTDMLLHAHKLQSIRY